MLKIQLLHLLLEASSKWIFSPCSSQQVPAIKWSPLTRFLSQAVKSSLSALTHQAFIRKAALPRFARPAEKVISATNYWPYPKPICLQASWLRVSCQPSAHTWCSVADRWTYRSAEEFIVLERVTAGKKVGTPNYHIFFSWNWVITL